MVDQSYLYFSGANQADLVIVTIGSPAGPGKLVELRPSISTSINFCGMVVSRTGALEFINRPDG